MPSLATAVWPLSQASIETALAGDQCSLSLTGLGGSFPDLILFDCCIFWHHDSDSLKRALHALWVQRLLVVLLPLDVTAQLPCQLYFLPLALRQCILQGVHFCFSYSHIHWMSSFHPMASTTTWILRLPDIHLQPRTLNHVACYSSPLKYPTGTTKATSA